MLRILILTITLSFTVYAKNSCNDLFKLSSEEQASSILASKISFSKKSEKINIIINNHLKLKGYSFHTKTIEGHKVYIINPGTNHKLSRLADYLERNYGVELGVSIGHTYKIDAGLEMLDEDLIITSVKDLLSDEVGAATRHELSHLWEISRFEQGDAHPVFSANIKSTTALFEQNIGYQHYITFGEIHAYARELHYSLWKYRNTTEAAKKQSIQADIDEAYSKLKNITSKLHERTKEISSNYKKFKVYKDDYIFELKTEGLSLEMARTEKSAKKQLQKIVDFIEEFSFLLNKTSISELEVMLKDFLKSLD